jgi:hypothetical protein
LVERGWVRVSTGCEEEAESIVGLERKVLKPLFLGRVRGFGFEWRSGGEGDGGALKESREGRGGGQRSRGCIVLILEGEVRVGGGWRGSAERESS